MQLDPDCVRDILLTIEETTGFRKPFSYPYDCERLNRYDKDVVLYHIRQCDLSGLLHKTSWFMGGTCLVVDLSPSGHQFLADIRTDKNWEKTKTVAANIGSFSLDAIKSIAAGVIASLINKQLGI